MGTSLMTSLMTSISLTTSTSLITSLMTSTGTSLITSTSLMTSTSLTSTAAAVASVHSAAIGEKASTPTTAPQLALGEPQSTWRAVVGSSEPSIDAVAAVA
eukprot:jgi/Chrpa1/13972/Chrysochromulina_OHIO_Genome00007055-RA